MKKIILLFAVVAALMLSACKDAIPTGGTIELYNRWEGTAFVTIIPVNTDILESEKKTAEIAPGQTEKIKFDKNGFYEVTAFSILPPHTFTQTVSLIAGIDEKVTIEE